MATNDLCNELSKDIKLDESMERKICSAVLKQLDDQSNDVQSVAVKCLGTLLKKVQQAQIGEISDKLCALILEGKDALRDIYSIGLKTLIADVPEEMGMLVSERLTQRLVRGINAASNDDVRRECLDNLGDLLRRFGHLMVREHDDIMNAIIRQLESDKPIIRKRAALCLGSLAVVSSDNLLNRLVEIILAQIDAASISDKKKRKSSSADIRTLIQTIGTISRTVGFRLGKYLDRLIPVFLKFCGQPDDEDSQNESSDELRENCFPGIESFVLRCPKEVVPYLPSILEVSLGFMKYDPNYCYDDNDTTAMDTEDNEGEEEFGDDNEDFGNSDDDDSSWKIRKAAIKVLAAIITARPELLNEIYTNITEVILDRFKEREENVRLDIITCFSSLLLVAAPSSRVARASAVRGGFGSESLLTVPNTLKGVTTNSTLVKQKFLLEKVSVIIKASQTYLLSPPTSHASSVKTKAALFQMLRILITVLQGGLEGQLPILLNFIEHNLHDKNQTLRLDALQLLRLVLEQHSATSLQVSIARIAPLVINFVKEDWYKVSAEALRVICATISVLRPIDPNTNTFLASQFIYQPFIQPIYTAIMFRLQALDIDQEIKEGAILAIGKLVYHAGDVIQVETPAILQLLLSRLENDVTRMPALRAFATIAASPLNINISSVLSNVITNLALFLRQQSRVLRQASLQTLNAIITSVYNSTSLSVPSLTTILQETSNHINDSDLHITFLSLKVALNILQNIPNTADIISQTILPKSLLLASSPLLQGAAQHALIELFQVLVVVHPTSYSMLLTSFLGRVSTTANEDRKDLPRESVGNLAKCVAGICLKAAPTVRDETLLGLANDLRGTKDSHKHLALLCIGELGQQTDLATAPDLKELILSCFESGEQETKTAAAYALGRLAVGSMSTYLPVVLSAVQSNRHQYLLLEALREIIVVHANTHRDFSSYLEAVLPGLLAHSHATEEGVRNMVAECLGALTAMHSERMFPVLEQLSAVPKDNLGRWTTASALRYALARHANASAMASSLRPLQAICESLLNDTDLDVKRATLMLVNAGVHHQPNLFEPFLRSLLPYVLATLDLKLERTVDLGPFKHKVDDGLPLRKVALNCVETVLDMLADHLDIASLTPKLLTCLNDKDDVRLQTHQIISKLCIAFPSAILDIIESLVDPLEKTINKKLITKDSDGGAGARVGPEIDRQLELLKSTLKTVISIQSIDDSNSNRRWTEFVERLTKREATATLMETLRHERNEII